jgi:NAD(P)-dependent dehydrogenase (short-subunit alcohol dehydrogenase family)
MQRLGIVTGTNRGIGFEVCRQLARLDYRVLLTSRDTAKGQASAQTLAEEGLPVLFHQLDVTNEASIAALRKFVVKEFGCLDVLVNNAGIYLKGDNSVMTLSLDILQRTLETNLFGALRMCQTFIPLMRKNNYGRVVNVSSTMGQHAQMHDMSAAYRLSKDALNALTQMIASSIHGKDILVNACYPGWVQTEMGGPHATRSLEEGADTIVWLATLPSGRPSSRFFKDRKRIEW